LKYPITNRCGETVEPSGHIRQRIGASICASRPNYKRELTLARTDDPVGYFLFICDEKTRKFYEEEWADFLLIALDKLGLQIVELDGEGT
jgi:hypothetical protein